MGTVVRIYPKPYLVSPRSTSHEGEPRQKLLPTLRGLGHLVPYRRHKTSSWPKRNLENKDIQIVQEFRAKLRLAEDMISKLAFSLREIQNVWPGKKSEKDLKKPARSKR